MVSLGLWGPYPVVTGSSELVPLSPAGAVGLELSQKAGDIPRAKALRWKQAGSPGLEISLTLPKDVHWETQTDTGQQMR